VAQLEHHDELGLPWDSWADGRVHRLVKGRDFLHGADVLQEAAENAARRLDKVALTVKEVRFGNVFVWVQFVDGEITLGEPCRCGSRNLRRVSLVYAECAACKATLFLRPPRPGSETTDAPQGADEDGAIIQTLLGVAPPRPKELRASEKTKRKVVKTATVDPRTDLTRLGAFTSVELYSAGSDGGRERLYGSARGPGDRTFLLVVDVALLDGRRMEDAAYPGGLVHVARAVPAGPFGDLVRLDRFPARTPDLRVDDPLDGVAGAAPERREPSAELAWLAPSPDRLSAFEGVTLFPLRKRGQTKFERHFGYGRSAADGETVLLVVRYRLRDGRRMEDPDHPDETLHTVRAVPLAPFGAVIDVGALLARQQDDGAGGVRRGRRRRRHAP
jgi:hypothetical protein